MASNSHPVDWNGATPVSALFDDPFYALSDGLAEARHVFLAGNDLPDRFAPGFRIAELGFGTGLNLLAAWSAWRRAGHTGPLRFTSFEAYPLAPSVIAEAQAAFPDVAEEAARLAPFWQADAREIRLPSLQFTLITGDARETLPRWDARADAWFLDGFAPAKNPEMWEAPLLHTVARKTAPGGTLATYTAAGHVRRTLAAAGLEVTRAPGYGRKRHMTRAFKPADRPAS